MKRNLVTTAISKELSEFVQILLADEIQDRPDKNVRASEDHVLKEMCAYACRV